jgi:hypothetical protein
MSNFKVGEKVVAKDTSTINGCFPFGIKAKEIYEIEEVSNCKKCGIELLALKNVDSGSPKRCECGIFGRSNDFYSWRFRKLDHQFSEDVIAEIIKQVKEESLTLSN